MENENDLETALKSATASVHASFDEHTTASPSQPESTETAEPSTAADSGAGTSVE
jgi:hypothetical protein